MHQVATVELTIAIRVAVEDDLEGFRRFKLPELLDGFSVLICSHCDELCYEFQWHRLFGRFLSCMYFRYPFLGGIREIADGRCIHFDESLVGLPAHIGQLEGLRIDWLKLLL